MAELTRSLILVVDDERTLQSLYRELCADEGWDCLCWTSPDTPAKVATVRPTLILADLVFGTDRDVGRRFIESLHADPTTRTIPIVCASADRHQLEEDQAWLEQLACSLLGKPFDIELLLAEIRRCLPWVLSTIEVRPVIQ
jgi:CheY-like chemotaxis protein